MSYFFVYPFAVDGTVDAIPAADPSTGSMSYQDGFTINYEQDLLTVPTALPIPRGQFNQLMFDVTSGIRQYQTEGTPDWITAADNAPGDPPVPTSFPYDIYARVRYDAGGGMQVYENQVAANTATPGADNSWLVISGGQQGVLPGTIIDFAGPVAPSGYLACDGSQVSRATYGGLLSVISQIQNGTTTNTLFTITGLSSTAQMFVGMAVEGVGIPASTTIASVDSGTQVTLSQAATASATVPVTFYSWGNGNGTTTFNVPDLRRKTTVGQGGSASTDPLGVGNVIGQSGGQESHLMTTDELVSHVHNPSPTANGYVEFLTTPGGVTGQPAAGSTLNSFAATGTNTTAGNSFNIIQPSAITLKCIKF